MSLPVIVLGAGGHAKVLIDALLKQSIQLLGITDPDPALTNATILGIPLLGDDDAVLRCSPDTVLLVNGVGSARTTVQRRQLFDRFKEKGYQFATVIHPSAVIATDVVMDEGAQVMAGVVIQTASKIGSNTIINTKASVDHDCTIADHVHIAPGVTLSGAVEVGSGTHIGAGATVIQGVKIGEESLIGAGSLVLNDVPARVTVIGVPAHVV